MSLTPTSKRKRTPFQRGYRSGLEIKIAEQLKAAGRDVLYEQEKLSYEWPPRLSKYTPDFKIITASGRFFYVESKGRFIAGDRQKHLLIKAQCPDIDIRFVFSNQNQKLYKGSKTSYADWCEKHGFRYASKTIPDLWLQE